MEGRIPLSLERLRAKLDQTFFNIEKGFSAILSKLKGGCHSIHNSVTLMDCRAIGKEAKLVVGDDVLTFQDTTEASKL